MMKVRRMREMAIIEGTCSQEEILRPRMNAGGRRLISMLFVCLLVSIDWFEGSRW